MYAVIESGGKQYRVAPGEVLDLELLAEVKDDGSVEFDRVLMVSGDDGVSLGSSLESALVKATVVDSVRGKKIRGFKMKRRKQYRRTWGHRQNYHRVRIDEIAV